MEKAIYYFEIAAMGGDEKRRVSEDGRIRI